MTTLVPFRPEHGQLPTWWSVSGEGGRYLGMVQRRAGRMTFCAWRGVRVVWGPTAEGAAAKLLTTED